ncbi:hypothetical protein Patl1_33114 [Pistacia atlantica]|uniref:Uncharacterized protein n=1 Tax=Pistacia atlantica TaxID=434234 RepID=A0ACC1AM37_9ROSI|nr:hypothetical protein Patl1_33114 [Pistacia atlantica]
MASNLRNRDIGKQTHAYLLRHGIQFEGMESYLIDMYAKSGLIRASQQNFERNHTGDRDQATWNAMIAGYTRNGLIEEAFITFRQMFEQNVTPNVVNIASVLPACNPMGNIELAIWPSNFMDFLSPICWTKMSLGYGGFGALGHSVYHRELFPRLVEGELYTWGQDEGDGRLGLGPGRGPNEGGGLSIPSKVKALPVPVAAVSCGGFFTTVLTKEGQLWNWGASSNYELGRGDKVGGWRPKPIPFLEDVCIIQMASGGYHSLALTDEGKLLSWGYGGHGLLGHSSTEIRKYLW